MEKVAAWRWYAVVALFTFVLTGAYALGFYALKFPTQKNVVHTKQLKAAVGSTDVVKIAEEKVAQILAANGGTVTGMKPVGSPTQGKDGAVVVKLRVQIAGASAPLVVNVTLTKSVYTVQSITRG